MPPVRPPPARKVSNASKDAAATPKPKSAPNASMPPPPDPVLPMAILEPEMNALSSCLRNAVVKTGQIYGYYADSKRLGIQKYAPYPPRSLTSALGREVEKYDQLCDAMESHLLRAIAVLQRDVAHQEKRIQAEKEAAAAAAAVKMSSPSNAAASEPPLSPSRSTLPLESSVDVASAAQGSKLPGILSARRQSTISLSSLQRPAFPHKLDLSNVRLNPEEVLQSGLSSPVTLAPKSALRTSVHSDLMMAALGEAASRPVDIDLTVSDADMDLHRSNSNPSLETSLGSSADKPIELDLDMDDIFVDAEQRANANSQDPGKTMFPSMPPHDTNTNAPLNMPDIKPKLEEHLTLDMFKELDHANGTEHSDIFASIDPLDPQGGTSQPPASDAQKVPTGAPSPGSILASFAGPSNPSETQPSQQDQASFDFNSIDLSGFQHVDTGFFGPQQGETGMGMMGMDDIFQMPEGGEPKPPEP
ncbi:hypothetical protein CERSUDRAFT_110091 [Gelatoporia subvermispora B]|uniref:Uncharacterized protein n=1 Tax=Ceriporiopsis subvermispora (strain B) TaxID=914234 RepID=M2QWP5_CERS8|nr:hypothetical protein CERSUDRAFT_110091 [Gelatoporia subvermispora B]